MNIPLFFGYRLLCFGCIVLFASFMGVAEAIKNDPLPSVTLKKLLSHMRSMEAHFEQKLLNEQGRILEKQRGQIFLKKPGRLYWAIEGDEQRFIISNGKKIWDFDPVLEQVIIQTVKGGADLTPVVFLSHDFGSFMKEFIIREIPLLNAAISEKTPRCLTQSKQCFVLKPKRAEQAFEKVEVGFKKGVLQELRLLDALGRYTHIVFTQIHINESIPDSKFQFKIPENVDILTKK